MVKIFIVYGIVMNLLGLLSMYGDKHRAIRQQWRIPEKTLFIVAFLGGSVGSIAGMYLFRHKTKHWYFVIGMPLIFFLQIGVIIGLIMLFR